MNFSIDNCRKGPIELVQLGKVAETRYKRKVYCAVFKRLFLQLIILFQLKARMIRHFQFILSKRAPEGQGAPA